MTKGQHEAIIELVLGDLYIHKGNRKNARLRFRQGSVNSLYLVHLFELFIDYCLSLPKFSSCYNKLTKKTYYSVSFQTR